MRVLVRWVLALGLLALAGAMAPVRADCTAGSACAAPGFTGVNLNGQPQDLDPRMLKATGAHWVRAFVDVLKAQDAGGLDAGNWKTFRAVGKTGAARTILSLKWDFATARQRPPLPGSPEEKALFAFLDRQILDPLAPTVAIIVSGNEPFVNTAAGDQQPDAAYGGIPLVVFYQRVTAHVNDYLTQAGLRGRVRLFVGAFTRLDAPVLQASPAVRQLLAFANATAFVDGVDVHTHVASLDEIDAALSFVQGQTSKPILVTEYTYVHAMKAGLAAGHTLGTAFAARWNLPPTMTEIDFLRCDVFHVGPACTTLPTVPKAEWDAFMTSRPWFIDHFMLKADQIFRAHRVMGATFGLVETRPGPAALQPDAMPWYLGFVYVGAALGDGPDGLPLPNTQNLDDLRQLTGAH